MIERRQNFPRAGTLQVAQDPREAFRQDERHVTLQAS
jgi:hypothetical protein